MMKQIKILVGLFFVIILCGCEVEDAYGYETDENDLTIHYIDVGQGDSIFLELTNSETMLIDAGEGSKKEVVKSYIDNLGYREIDYLVGTHPHTDHIGGMSYIIDSYIINNIYMPKATSTSNTYLNLLKNIDSKGLTISTTKKGLSIVDEDDLKIEVLSPIKDNYEELNNYSVVLLLTYKDIKMLFMGDAEKEIEEELFVNDVDVIKVGHHGSNSSSSKAFISRINPTYAIICVGKDNSYKHPHQEIIDRYELFDTTIYRTDLNGNIIVKSNGKNITVESEK